jgi:chromosome segregation ATPase
MSKSKESIEKLISIHQRHLQKLKERQASPRQVHIVVPPKVQMEIEDLEVEIQRLKTALADEDVKNREELERVLAIREQRLQALRKTQTREGGNYEQEIEEIEAKIQELQNELDQLSR